MNIPTTGTIFDENLFPPEVKIFRMLERHGWIVDPQKTYVPQIPGDTFSLDLMASKKLFHDGVNYNTVLLIDCKKSSANDWLFFTTRDSRGETMQPHLPMVNWSNNRYLGYALEKIPWKRKMSEMVPKYDFLKKLYRSERQTVGFREMPKSGTTTHGDGEIGLYLDRLVKALGFELNTLNRSDGSDCFYNFNLLLPMDEPFKEVYASGHGENQPVVGAPDQLGIVHRCVLEGKEFLVKIEVCTFQAFERRLLLYDQLHEWNSTFFAQLMGDFFDGIFKDPARKEYQLKHCRTSFIHHLNREISGNFRHMENKLVKDLTLRFNSNQELLEIDVYADDDVNSFLNESEEARKIAKKFLKEWFKFDGQFNFSEPLWPINPFDSGIFSEPGMF
jgi:hypothetical protein